MELTPINQTSNLFTSSKVSSTQDFSTSSNSYALSEMNSNKQSDIKMESPFSDIEEDELAFMQDMATILVTLKKAEATPQPKNNKTLKRKRFQRSRGSFSDLSEEGFDSDSIVDRKTESMVLDETDSTFSADIFGRKKAPSGTACEKHKKEKKRCPEDCPMRKNNQKNIESKLQEQKQQISDEENHPVFITARQIVKMTEELIAQLHQDNWEGTSTKLFHYVASMKDCPSDIEKFEISEKEPKTKEECMEFIQSIMRQLNEISPKESAGPIQEPPSPKVEESLPVEEETTVRKKRRVVETPNYRYEMEMQESPKFKKSSPTKACEYHTTVHARCPPNCPDRRPVVKIQKQNSDDSLPQPTKEVVEANISESEMETPIMDSPAPEKPKTPTLNKSTRKYVSVACERHKILHARCPANCPDRLAKDAQRMEEIRNGNGLVSEETTS